jgi:hypothetical protein
MDPVSGPVELRCPIITDITSVLQSDSLQHSAPTRALNPILQHHCITTQDVTSSRVQCSVNDRSTVLHKTLVFIPLFRSQVPAAGELHCDLRRSSSRRPPHSLLSTTLLVSNLRGKSASAKVSRSLFTSSLESPGQAR